MGYLDNGIWQASGKFPTNKSGSFVRPESSFRSNISKTEPVFKPEAGRYHLYVSYACPWAHRTLIMRKLKQLDDIITFSSVEPLMLENGWSFGSAASATADAVNSCAFLHEVYTKAQPDFTGRVTVPVLWDKKTNTIVNNESAEIIRILNSGFNELTNTQTDYYPAAFQTEIDSINEFVYANINNGVYRCGFATTQAAYETAFDSLFAALDKVETILTQHEFLIGDNLTEADIRLFTTLIRFDAVYVGHFKCNLRRIADYPAMSKYLNKLYNLAAFKDTTDFNHIKSHYYESHRHINPTGIVPKGPKLDFSIKQL